MVKYFWLRYTQESEFSYDYGHYFTKSKRKLNQAIKDLKAMKDEGVTDIYFHEYKSKKELEANWDDKIPIEEFDQFIQ